MTGKVVVVTGSTKGIGKGLAREFLKRGHSVVISGRKQADAEAVATELGPEAVSGVKASGVACEVTDYAHVQNLWDKAIAAFGRVDIWINNAGMCLYGATKFGVTYFTKALIAETKDGPVRVGYLSPGIVITDLSVRDKTKVPPKQWEFTILVYNILADRVETVTPWLVENVLANTTHGARIAWLTRGKSLWRFLRSRFIKTGDRFPELKLPNAA